MTYPNYELESQAKMLGYKYIAGVDEVGRGGGAGPVVAAAVNIPKTCSELFINKVNDSKKLSIKRREELYTLIMDNCIVGIHEVSAKIIDEINILEATKLAMKGAIDKLAYYDYILVDGTVDLTKLVKYCPCQRVIKGDTLSISIAAASIVAKVYRDRLMDDLHKEFPIYGWDSNRSYLTEKHREAIKIYGPCEYHRKSFAGVKEYL